VLEILFSILLVQNKSSESNLNFIKNYGLLSKINLVSKITLLSLCWFMPFFRMV